ncbi:MAG: PilZ domain-containing protein [Phycisphaerales bacterium]|nr:PilZ domain-containing protein [Phycisphaerales bacterium]
MERIQLSAVNLLAVRDDEVAANRRRPGRVRCERLRCSNGTVLDLSRTGARIRVRSLFAPRAGQKRALVFQTVMGKSLPFPCRVVWVARRGALLHEVGVEFHGLTDSLQRQLVEIGRVHGQSTMINADERVA